MAVNSNHTAGRRVGGKAMPAAASNLERDGKEDRTYEEIHKNGDSAYGGIPSFVRVRGDA